MGLYSNYSDYGSGGSSMNSSTSWGSQELDWQTFQSQLQQPRPVRTKAASFSDLVNGRCTIEDVMREFRMNGSDAPYNPDDDQAWTREPADIPPGITPANVYMRQKSWPAPDRTPSQRLPRPMSASFPLTATQHEMEPMVKAPPGMSSGDALTWEQRRVLNTLSDAAVLTLLREMQRRNKRQPTECRFCKNNGERESYYRSHTLKGEDGKVSCPVLRAFVCKRCGARGDNAHTIKYCPLSTSEERIKSAAMMRSVRMASGRRRAPSGSAGENYVVFGSAPAAVLQDGEALAAQQMAPLDPRWAALEQKLMLY